MECRVAAGWHCQRGSIRRVRADLGWHCRSLGAASDSARSCPERVLLILPHAQHWRAKALVSATRECRRTGDRWARGSCVARGEAELRGDAVSSQELGTESSRIPYWRCGLECLHNPARLTNWPDVDGDGPLRGELRISGYRTGGEFGCGERCSVIVATGVSPRQRTVSRGSCLLLADG